MHEPQGTRGAAATSSAGRGEQSPERLPPGDPPTLGTSAKDFSVAKRDVVKILRALPSAGRVLCNDENASNQELLQALTRFESPRRALRAAGCGVVEVQRVLRLLPYALRAPTNSTRRCSVPSKTTVCGGFLMLTSGVVLTIVLVMIFSSIASNKDWQTGNCKLAAFSNNTCAVTGCSFDIDVVSNEDIFKMKYWKPSLERISAEGHIRFKGEPFRCCDQARRLDCCSFLDPVSLEFCDNWWMHTDADGDACPSGAWDCLFKTITSTKVVGGETLEYEEVTEIRLDEGLGSLPLLAVAAGLLGVVGMVICMRLWQRLRLPSCLKSSFSANPGYERRRSMGRMPSLRDIPVRKRKQKKTHVISRQSRHMETETDSEKSVGPCEIAAQGQTEVKDAVPDPVEVKDPVGLNDGGLSKLANVDTVELIRPIITPLPAGRRPRGMRCARGTGGRPDDSIGASVDWHRRDRRHKDPPIAWAWGDKANAVDGHHILDVDSAHTSLRVTALNPQGAPWSSTLDTERADMRTHCTMASRNVDVLCDRLPAAHRSRGRSAPPKAGGGVALAER